jgi:hypothetical protein
MIKKSVTSETPNQYSFWSYCFALVSTLVLIDVLTGGLIRESLALHKIEYTIGLFAMIATLKVFISDGSLGVRFARAYFRQKL